MSETAQRTASFNGAVHSVLYHGSTVYVGGDFTQATDDSGTVRRNHAAAIDVRTGQVLEWNPRVNGRVRALAASGSHVYLGGNFTRVDGARRVRIAAVSAAGRGNVRAFRHRANRTVNTLAIRGGRLYVGGDFTTIDGRTRKRLAGFDLRSKALLAWRPSANDSVLALAVGRRRVYVAGSFTRLNGRTSHAHLSAVSPGTARIDPTFDPVARYPFLDLELGYRGLYAAGDGPGGRLVKFSLRGASRWMVAANGAVQAIAVFDNRIYAGGHFQKVCTTRRIGANGECADGSVERRKMFAATTATGGRTPWSPGADSVWGVRAMDVHERRGLLAVGGDFQTLGGQGTWVSRPFFAQFR